MVAVATQDYSRCTKALACPYYRAVTVRGISTTYLHDMGHVPEVMKHAIMLAAWSSPTLCRQARAGPAPSHFINTNIHNKNHNKSNIDNI